MFCFVRQCSEDGLDSVTSLPRVADLIFDTWQRLTKVVSIYLSVPRCGPGECGAVPLGSVPRPQLRVAAPHPRHLLRNLRSGRQYQASVTQFQH